MRLDPLYRAVFTTPESWSVDLGGEGQSFLIAEGRTRGRVDARLRAANYPRRRADDVLLPDFRGVLETDDGATILFTWRGVTRTSAGGMRELVGSITHVAEDERYSWLNEAVGAVAGDVRSRDGGGFDIVLEVSELVWEPLA